MKHYQPKQCVELFHLLFLSHLGRKIDKRLYALKGGCNMRFYFKSIRYSEDIDIDVRTINKDTLFKNVQNILTSTSFKHILKTQGIEITQISSPKQTQTTQRWKVELKAENIALLLHTSIEFSRREFDDNTLFEPVDAEILRQYSLPQLLVNHYSVQTMLQQKIRALALRSETQSRDIFDLYLLINLGNHYKLDPQTTSLIAEAESKAQAVTFADYKGQVVAYLPEDYLSEYNDKPIFEFIVNTVIEFLASHKNEIN